MADPLNLLASGEGLDPAVPVAGLNLLADPNAPGPFRRGLGAGTSGVKSSLFGAGALAARALGARELEQAALDKAAAASEASAQGAVQFQDVVDDPTRAGEYFKYLLGQAVPSLAIMAAGGGFGALAGRAVAGQAGMAAARTAGVVAPAVRTGALLGAVAPDVALEAGGIFPEALKTGVENPALRAAGGGALAAALDFIPLLAAEKYLRPIGKGGFGAMAKGTVKGAPVGAALEGSQELGQAIIERAAAGRSLISSDAITDYIESFFAGAAPGSIFGGMIGARRGSAAPVQETPPSTIPGQPPIVNEPVQNVDTSAQVPIVSNIETPPASILGDLEAQHIAAQQAAIAADQKVAAMDTAIESMGRRVPKAVREQRMAALKEQEAAHAAVDDLAAQSYLLRSEQPTVAPVETPLPEIIADNALIAPEPSLIPDTSPVLKSVVEPVPRTDQPRTVQIGGEAVPETRATEKAVAAVQRSLGFLHRFPAKELGATPVSAQDIVQTEGRAPRSTQATGSQAQMQAIEPHAMQVIEPMAMALAKAKSNTVSGQKKVADSLTKAMRKVVNEAQKLPTVEAAQEHITKAMPAALKGLGVHIDAPDMAKAVSAAVGQATTLYSKGAVDEENITRRLGEVDGLGVPISKATIKNLSNEQLYVRRDAIVHAFDRATDPTQPAAIRRQAGNLRRKMWAVDREMEYRKALGQIESYVTPGYLQSKRYGVAESRAALTQDEFDALSEPAKYAAVDEFNRIMMARGTELRAHLTQLVGIDPALVVKTFQATPDSPIGSYTRVDKLKSVIALALNAKQGLSVADHEGFHYAEDRLLTSAERQIVANALKEGHPLFNQLMAKVQQYDRENRTNLADEVSSTPAEARAYAFEFWRRGELQTTGALNRIFAKIRVVLERIANFIKGQGFQSIEDVFTALDRGQFAERTGRDQNGLGLGTLASGASESPWYRSALTDAVTAMATKAASAQGWKEQIKGLVAAGKVKQAEIDAVGLNEFLDLQQGRVTKDQVVSFLQENGVRVEETTLGDVPTHLTVAETTDGQWIVVDNNSHETVAEFETLEEAEDYTQMTTSGATKFNRPDLNLPGGQNYRELLLTLPVSENKGGILEAMELANANGRSWAEMGESERQQYRDEARRTGQGDFRSSHFDQPNIFAHIRFNERTDASGARVLFLEELQSDWAQKGKKTGFYEPGRPWEVFDKTGKVFARFATHDEARDDAHARGIAFDYGHGKNDFVPSAPFVTKTEAWVALSLKRMIRYAAENGFDKVAWTTGEQQASRYDLSKQVSQINVVFDNANDRHVGVLFKNTGDMVFRVDKDGVVSSGRSEIVGKPLDQVIGKDMAEKVMALTDNKTFEGLDLKVGGEGMKAFYDKIVPSVANEVLRKLGGGRVTKIEIGAPTTATTLKGDEGFQSVNLGFTLTSQMADRVATGLPLFSRAAIGDIPPAYSEQAFREKAARYAAGELPREQFFDAMSQMMDHAQSHIPETKAMLKSTGTELVGAFQRARTYISTGNYIAKVSKGFKNVMRPLYAQEQYKDRLIVDGSEVGLSTWHNATQEDREITFDALMKRNIGGFLKGSPEFMAIYNPLSPSQRAMFEQVSGNAAAEGVIAKFLRMEFDAETNVFQRIMTAPEFEKWKQERGDSVTGLIDSGYVPERRYGDHTVSLTVDVQNPDGTTRLVNVAFERFETAAFAAVRVQQYKAEIERTGAAVRAEQGFLHAVERDNDLSIQQVLDLTRRQGIQLQQVEIEKLSRALLAADSMRRNRLMRREHVPGMSRNGWRVLNEWVTGMSGRIAHSTFSDAVNSSLDGKPVEAYIDAEGQPVISIRDGNLWKEDGPRAGFYRNLADQRADFVLTPGKGSAISTKLRTAAMTYFLGGSLGAGVVQMFSVPMNTLPYLSQHTPYTNAFSTTLAAWGYTLKNAGVLRDINTLKNPDIAIPGLTPELRQALIQAAQDGTNSSTEIHQIMGISRGGILAQSRTVQRAMEVWMAPFKFGENTSRVASFIAAWNVATTGNGVALKQADGTYAAPRKLSGRELYEFAKNAVDETQNRYDPVNRPAIAHHPIGALLFMFKSFPLFVVEMIETMFKQNPKSAVYMLLGLVAMTGVQGLPFAEDILDIIDVISQKIFGSPFQVRRAMRNMLKDASEAMVGADLSNLVMRGMVNDLVGLNAATRVGNGDLIPGTRLGAADMDYGRLAEQFLGAPVSMVVAAGGQVPKFVGGMLKGDFDQMFAALRAGGPVTVRNAIKGYEQATTGFALDARGQNVEAVSGPLAMFQSIGLTSGTVTKAYDLDAMDKQRNAFYRQASADIQQQLVQAIRDGDSAKAQEVYEAVTAWNEANPEMPLMPNPSATRRAIMMAGLPLNARTLMLMPRALRGSSISGE